MHSTICMPAKALLFKRGLCTSDQQRPGAANAHQLGMVVTHAPTLASTPKQNSQMPHEMPAHREAHRVRAMTPLFCGFNNNAHVNRLTFSVETAPTLPADTTVAIRCMKRCLMPFDSTGLHASNYWENRAVNASVTTIFAGHRTETGTNRDWHEEQPTRFPCCLPK